MGELSELRMDAYYYGFDPTGIAAIDKILSAVACAGKAFHYTSDWNDESEWPPHQGSAPVEWIQNAANEAAEQIRALIAQEADQYEGEREVVARIVDPYAWRIADAPLRLSDTKYDRAEIIVRCEDSLAKADAILSALSAPSPHADEA